MLEHVCLEGNGVMVEDVRTDSMHIWEIQMRI